MKQILIVRESQGIPTWAIPLSDDNQNIRLAAGVQSSITVPTGAKIALVAGNDDYFVGKAAVALPGAAFAANPAHQNKEVIDLETNTAAPVTDLYFIARGAMDISVSFYGI